MSHLAGGFVFAVFLVAAAVFDLRIRRIPNALTATCALAGFVLLLVIRNPAETRAGLTAFAVAVVAGGMMQWMRVIGGGDVKLFAASALWLRGASFDAALATAIAGGVLAAFYLRSSARRDVGLADGVSSGMSRLQLDDGPDMGRVPYGVAIAIGCLWTWFDGATPLRWNF